MEIEKKQMCIAGSNPGRLLRKRALFVDDAITPELILQLVPRSMPQLHFDVHPGGDAENHHHEAPRAGPGPAPAPRQAHLLPQGHRKADSLLQPPTHRHASRKPL